MLRCRLALILSIFLFCLTAGKAEKLCRKVAVGSSVAVKCYASIAKRNASKGINIKWKTKIDTDQRDDIWTSVLVSDKTKIRDCPNSNHSDCQEDNVISVLYIRDFNQSDVVIYSCFSEDDVEIDGARLATECQLPVTLTKHGCLYYMVFEKLKCCWEWSGNEQIYTNFTMTTNYPRSGNGYYRKTERPCDVSHKICCDGILDNPYMEHSVRLSAKIGNETIKSAKGTIIPTKHIKPYKPNITRTTPKTNRGHIGIIVEWKSHNDDVHSWHYKYTIRYHNTEDNTSWKEEEVTSKERRLSISDKDLQSNSRYEIQVRARANDDIIGGVWSDWSDSKFVRTSQKAPRDILSLGIPIVSKVMLPNGTILNIVKLTWQKYRNTREEEFFTNISCREPVKDFSEIKQETSVILHTTSDIINCVGKFCNKAGCSSASHPVTKNIFVETDHFPMPARNVSVDSSILQFTMEASSNTGVTLQARICSSARNLHSDMAATFDGQSECLVRGFSYEDRNDLSASNTHFEMNGKWSPCRQYIVIIESEDLNGYIWKSNASQIVQYDPKVQENVRYTLADSSSPTKAKIAVTWTTIPSNEFMNRQLRYKSVGGTECEDDHKQTCNRTFSHNVAQRNSTGATLINDVFGSTEYEVKEWLVCPKERGDQQLQPFAVEVPVKSEVIKTAVTKPGKPRQLLISPLNSRRPTLSWTPPLHKNGIPEYEIVQYDMHGGEKSRLRTAQNEQVVDTSCRDPNDTFSFVVTAINEAIESDSAVLEDATCVMLAGGDEQSKVVVTVILVIIIMLVSVSIIILYCCRKSIKMRLKNRFYAPSPKIDKYIINNDAVQYKTAEYNDSQSEFYTCVVSPPKGSETHYVVERNEGKLSSSVISVPQPTPSKAQRMLLDQNFADNNNLSEYTTEQSVASNDGNFRTRDRTISTASTVPASTSCDSCIKQYVKIAKSPLDKPCQDLELSLLNQNNTMVRNTSSSDSEYLADVDSAATGTVAYTDVEVDYGEENALSVGNDAANAFNNETRPTDDLSYTFLSPEESKPNEEVSTKLLNNERFSFKRQSSSSSGIIEDLNEFGDTLQAEMTNFLTTCVPSVVLPVSSSEVDSVETGSNCRNYEMDDIENVISDDDASQEVYVDLERVTLLSSNV